MSLSTFSICCLYICFVRVWVFFNISSKIVRTVCMYDGVLKVRIYALCLTKEVRG